MNREKRPGLFLQIAAVLLCLCMISTHFTTGLYAKYTNRATRSDAARAAKLDVSATVKELETTTSKSGTKGEQGEIDDEDEFPEDDIIPVDDPFTRLYQVNLNNGSEVAIRSKIVLTFAEGIVFDAADVVKYDAEEGGYVVDTTIVTNAGNELKIEQKDIAPLTPVTLLIRAHINIDSLITTLTSTADVDDTSDTFLNEDMSSLTGNFPFELRVTFTQID